MYTSHSTSHFHSLLFMPSLGTLLQCGKMAWWIALNETWQAWSETKYTYRSQWEISVGKGICPWELDDLIFLESIEGEDQLLIDASCLQNICGLHEPAWDCMHTIQILLTIQSTYIKSKSSRAWPRIAGHKSSASSTIWVTVKWVLLELCGLAEQCLLPAVLVH